MFRTSRIRIIVAIMASILVFMLLTTAFIYLLTYIDVKSDSKEMLERYVAQFSLDNPPGQKKPGRENESEKDPKPPKDETHKYQLSTFYSVAFSPLKDEIIVIDNPEKNLYTDQELVSLAGKILDEGKTQGHYNSLLYCVKETDEYVLAAFMDDTVSDSSLHTFLKKALIAGGASVVIVLVPALLISRSIIHPLEENDKRERAFVSDAGHELKTPVSAVNTNVEMLKRQIGENEWLSNIEYENERMGNLITSLLDLSRIENTKPDMETVDFGRLVTGEILHLESTAFENGKTIESNISDEVYVKANKTRLTQVVTILLDNAICHSVDNAAITVILKHTHKSAVLSVSNEAEKISDDALLHIFDRFYRVDSVRNGDSGHYGLGLSVAKAIVTEADGKITAEYANGKITFTVFLPTN